MAEAPEKRSSQAGAHELPDVDLGGVGGRQGDPHPSAGGGGYLENCGGSKSPFGVDRDPRLAELERMGVARTHIRVAEEIGVDAFLAMWRVYDGDPAYRTDKGDLEVTMRPFRSYLRFQRNRFIETLYASGITTREIRARVKSELSESLSLDHISRVARRR